MVNAQEKKPEETGSKYCDSPTKAKQSSNYITPSIHPVTIRHVKSFSNIRIDLLDPIVVTFATSHLLMSPLKAQAIKNVLLIEVTLLTSHILMSPFKDRMAT